MSSVANSTAGGLAPDASHGRGIAGVVGATALVILAGWFLAAERLAYERDETVSGLQSQTEGLALAFDEHTARALKAADLFLLRVRDHFERDRKSLNIEALLESSGFNARAAAEVGLITDPGTPIWQSHRGPQGDRLVVGLPLQDSRTGRSRLPVSRPLGRVGEEPVGIAVLWVSPDYFTSFFGKVEFGPNGVVALLGLDGIVRARQTGAGTSVGADARSSSIFEALSKSPTGNLRAVSAIDGLARYVSYRKMDGMPLVVVIGAPEKEAFAAFENRRRYYLAAGIAMTLLLLLAAAGATTLIRRAQRAALAVAGNESWFRVLFEGNPIPLWVYDLETLAFLEVNPAACTKYGYSREEFLAMTIRDIRPEEDLPALDKELRSKKPGLTHAGVWRHRVRDGSVINVEVVSREVRRNGRRARFVCPIDVTERLRAEREIQELNADLERRVEERTRALANANQELEAFSYTVSHDLRAPLRKISGFSELMAADFAANLPEEGRRRLQKIKTGAEQMGSLIDALLAFSHIGKQALQHAPLDMQRLAEAALSETAAAYEGRCEVLVEALPAARGDPALIRQVWINLLSNALKYSSRVAQPRIEVGSQLRDGEVVYFVRDNGAGFDPAHARKLFGVFERLHGEKEFPGTGAGLAIVRRIVERHDGAIWAESAPGLGATFFFTLGSDTP